MFRWSMQLQMQYCTSEELNSSEHIIMWFLFANCHYAVRKIQESDPSICSTLQKYQKMLDDIVLAICTMDNFFAVASSSELRINLLKMIKEAFE